MIKEMPDGGFGLKRHYLTPPTLEETRFWLRWDYLGWRHELGSDWSQHSWNQVLVTRINQIKNDIHREMFQQGTNPNIDIITCSPEVGLILESSVFYVYVILSNIENHMGTLQDRYSIYHNMDQETNRLYLGTEEHPNLGCIIIDNLP